MDFEKLLKDLMQKSFPELKNTNISIEFCDADPEGIHHCAYSTEGDNFYIEIDPILRAEEEPIIIGFLVHELCHIVWEVSLVSDHFKKDLSLYKNYAPHRKRDERCTDLEVILRGYGTELRACNARYYPDSDEGYLTLKELEKLGL